MTDPPRPEPAHVPVGGVCFTLIARLTKAVKDDRPADAAHWATALERFAGASSRMRSLGLIGEAQDAPPPRRADLSLN